MELRGSATRLRQGYGVPSIEDVAIGSRAGRQQRSQGSWRKVAAATE